MLVTTNEASRAVSEALEELGVQVIRVPATAEGRVDMRVTLRELAAREVVSVLCEGGAELAGSLLAGGLPSELHVFVAPVMLGPRGRPGAVDWGRAGEPVGRPAYRVAALGAVRQRRLRVRAPCLPEAGQTESHRKLAVSDFGKRGRNAKLSALRGSPAAAHPKQARRALTRRQRGRG